MGEWIPTEVPIIQSPRNSFPPFPTKNQTDNPASPIQLRKPKKPSSLKALQRSRIADWPVVTRISRSFARSPKHVTSGSFSKAALALKHIVIVIVRDISSALKPRAKAEGSQDHTAVGLGLGQQSSRPQPSSRMPQ